MRGRGVWAIPAILLLSLLFRLPVLLNAGALDSDIAVAGLQAQHVARGQLAWLLWGTDYQGLTPVLFAALFDRLLPLPPAVTLLLSSLAGFALLLVSVLALLRRALGAFAAFGLTSCLVFVPEPFNFLTYSACRIWSFALLLLGLVLLERARERLAQSPGPAGRPTLARMAMLAALAGLCAGLGFYSDLFVMQLLPGALVYALLWLWDLPPWRPRGLGAAAVAFGFLIGSVPRWLAGMRPPALGELSLDHVRSSWDLFWQTCLPYLVGWKLFPALDGFTRPEFVAGPLVRLLAVIGLSVAGSVAVAGLVRSFLPERLGLSRRLAWCGSVWMATSIAGFLLSRRGVDMMSARYLAPVLLGFPLVAAPLVALFGRLQPTPNSSAVVWAPVALHFAVSGWLGYGSWVKGALPQPTVYASAVHEDALLAALERRGVKAGLADYWIAYRLTFLWRERIPVAPTYSDRHQPYQNAFDRATRVALVGYRSPAGRQFAPPARPEDLIAADVRFETITVGPFTAHIIERQ